MLCLTNEQQCFIKLKTDEAQPSVLDFNMNCEFIERLQNLLM